MTVSLVVAVADNGVIGRNGRLPWRMSSDLKEFRRVTMGKPLIMGRKTFQSIGRPLDGRDTIVVTRDPPVYRRGRTRGRLRRGGFATRWPAGRRKGGRRSHGHWRCRGLSRCIALRTSRIFDEGSRNARGGYVLFSRHGACGLRETIREAVPQGPRDDYPSTRIALERRGTS